MMRYWQASTTLRLLVTAVVLFGGCAIHTKPAPAKRVVHLRALTRPSGDIPSARRPVNPRSIQIVETTQTKPCVFRGSLMTSGRLYLQANAELGGIGLAATAGVQLERLELPKDRGERAKLVVTFPIEIEAYMNADENVVHVDKRLDIVPGHAWFDPRTPLHASFRSGDTAELSAQFSEGTSPPAFVTTVRCADLSLQQTEFHKRVPSGDSEDLRAGRIPMYESAGGREVAAIRAGDGYSRTSVWPIERKPGWVLVEGNDEFHFKGWIQASSVSTDPGFGIIGLLHSPEVTHQVTLPIPLRLEAKDTSPVIAKAAKGAEILMTAGPPGYRKIDFGLGVNTSFFAREVDLRGAVRLADGVEPGEPELPDSPEEATGVDSGADSAPRELTPIPPPAIILPPSIDKIWDLTEVPVHASLEEGVRRIQKGDWAAASNALSTAVNRLSDSEFEAKIIGYALLGRACDRKGDERCAKTAYSKVLELAKASEAKIKAVVALRGDDAATMVARIVLAQGEALFYNAEQKRKAAEAIQYPYYRGSGEKDDVLEHINGKTMDWIRNKRPLVEEAAQAYAEIRNLEPEPPPGWHIFATGRVGDLLSAFVYEFQTLSPLPAEWNQPGTLPGTDLTYEQLRTEYLLKLEDAAAPQRKAAGHAYTLCRDLARKHGIAVAEGKRCEERLLVRRPDGSAGPSWHKD